MKIIPIGGRVSTAASVATAVAVPSIGSDKDKALASSGITLDKTFASLYEHLTAMVEEVSYDNTGRATVKMVNNWPVQEKAQEKILRVTGAIKADPAPMSVVVKIEATAQEVKELVAMAMDVKGQLSSLRVSGRQTGEVIDVKAG